MIKTARLVKESISTVQAQIELLENCLHSPNSEHEQIARLFEIANRRGISVPSLREEIHNLVQMLEKICKLSKKIKEKLDDSKISLLEIVKCNFLLKEALGIYGYLIEPEAITNLTKACIKLYKAILNDPVTEDSQKNDEYIILESLKHELNALLEVGLQNGVFSKSEISDFNLGNITSQESEDVLLFLSAKMKWQPVYDRLAKS